MSPLTQGLNYRSACDETCPANRKVKSTTGSLFVFMSREAEILAQNALETVWRIRPDPLGELTALPQTP